MDGACSQITTEKTARQLLTGDVEGRRCREGPRSNWIKVTERDIAELGVRNWRRIAGNRESCRRICLEDVRRLRLGSFYMRPFLFLGDENSYILKSYHLNHIFFIYL